MKMSKTAATRIGRLIGGADEFQVRRWIAFKHLKLTQAEIAAQLECSQSMVSQLLAGRVRAFALELAFARLVDVEHAALFPPHPREPEAAEEASVT